MLRVEEHMGGGGGGEPATVSKWWYIGVQEAGEERVGSRRNRRKFCNNA